ncbi:MAG TPA: SMP-30/gluconolactonase/LRE family protein [Acidimicrobiales bacterium]
MGRPAWTPVLTGLAFAEAPRWHDGALFVSDIFGRQVWRVVPGEAPEVIHEVPGLPSGLGWLPDGRMLIVSMRERRVLVADGDGLREYADLSALVGGDCNDMVVDAKGRCYVGNFGYDLVGGAERRPTGVVLVDQAGEARMLAEGLWFPNGLAITPDGRTLLVAETRGARISAFTIADDGSLHDRRSFAEFAETGPDGICLDAEGALWLASPSTGEVLRVADGGEVVGRLDTPQGTAQACMLGGPDGRSLFVCSTPTHIEHETIERRPGRVEMVEVDVPHAGRP